MAFVEFGRPDSRTTLTARDTASLTPPSSLAPDGLTLNATIIFQTPRLATDFREYGPTLPHLTGTRW
jgi:hypothetical protein